MQYICTVMNFFIGLDGKTYRGNQVISEAEYKGLHAEDKRMFMSKELDDEEEEASKDDDDELSLMTTGLSLGSVLDDETDIPNATPNDDFEGFQGGSTEGGGASGEW